ncbi:MAG TPA: hypothetical protein VG502_03370 [Flexivirga sp.]|uniref:COG4315 family predicted lipoprotein n=1 Tax=Flexivirga sp. TaxID=1962927 RepID=UPI002CA16244|nr:hypothetical protein [Flexivirga sp.]HWC21318.1 hypothetical protein [Flexivirga sp.]
MRSTRGLGALGAVALVATLAACGSSGSSGGGTSAAPATSSGMTSSAAAGAAAGKATLSITKTSLGPVVTGPDGRTVYQYDKDTKGSGKTACSGPCVSKWPAVTVAGTPKVMGITGKVGTIKGMNGEKQVTLDGWPLYYYAGDGSAGDVNGQGFKGIWWALNSKGAKVTTSPASSTGGGKGGSSY